MLAAETLDSVGLAQQGYQGVHKTLVLDLLANGYDTSIGKAEDLAILNDSTVAVGNDNDFGVAADASYSRLVGDPTNLSKLYVFTLPRTRRLTTPLATRVASKAAGWPLYPNPVPAGQPVQLLAPAAYEVLDATGRLARRGVSGAHRRAGTRPVPAPRRNRPAREPFRCAIACQY